MLRHVIGNSLPPISRDAWRRTLQMLINYRGYSSPEKLAANFTPLRLSYNTIRRIMALSDEVRPGSDEWFEKLAVLSGMLELPPDTLRLFYRGDVDALTRLTFARAGGEEIREFLLGALHEPRDPPNRRRRAH